MLFKNVVFKEHCDFAELSQNRHFQSTLLVGMDGGGGSHKKENRVYALHTVDNSG